jgi:hypothetical protein
METIIVLKFNVDAEQLAGTNDDLKAKLRGYVADIIGDAFEKDAFMRFIASAVGETNQSTGHIEIQQSNKVIKRN